MPGFTELIGAGEIQRANQTTLRQQFAGNLAVRPGVNTEALAAPAIRRFSEGATLSIAEQRSKLAEDALDFRRSQLPFETAIGAVGAAASVLDVVRDRQQAASNRKALSDLTKSFEQAQARNRAFTRSFIEKTKLQTQQANQALQPVPVSNDDDFFRSEIAGSTTGRPTTALDLDIFNRHATVPVGGL